MKSGILLSLLLLSSSMTCFCTTWTITNSGTSFSPITLTIMSGDSVNFVLESAHDAREVSLATWNANGTTALPGFQTPFGGGLVLPAQLGVGTHYYVCSAHVSFGMKGTIIVQGATGISPNKWQTNVSVYPNPATDLLNIKISNNQSGMTYTMVDQTGRLVLTGKLNEEITSVDINQLVTGVYMLLIGEPRKQTYLVIKK